MEIINTIIKACSDLWNVAPIILGCIIMLFGFILYTFTLICFEAILRIHNACYYPRYYRFIMVLFAPVAFPILFLYVVIRGFILLLSRISIKKFFKWFTDDVMIKNT